MLMKKNDSLRALRNAGPRSQPGFDALVRRQARIRDTILASETAAAGSARREDRAAERVPGRSLFRPSRRLVGLSAGAACAVAAAAVAAVLLLGGGSPSFTPTPALAAEAVKQAAVDTTSAAKSGIIETVLLIDGEAQVMNRISWNGADVALMVHNDEQRQIRYVGGLYYETYGYSVPIEMGDTSHDGQWIHVTGYDNGGAGPDAGSANEQLAPAAWLAAARGDLAGQGLVQLVSEGQGYTRTPNADGSVTYSATTTVAAVRSADWDLAGLPIASQPPFKVKDESTPVTMTVTVGRDGLVQQVKLAWTLDLPGEASSWSYTTTFSQLGTAPAIAAPDAGHTQTTDSRFEAGEPGPM